MYAALLAVWLVWFVYKSLDNGTKVERTEQNTAYLLIAFSSFVWYFVLANHTIGHHFFTYRIWVAAITAILFLFCGSVVAREEKPTAKARFLLLFRWGILGVIAIMLTFTAREDVTFLNGNVEYEEIELPEGEQIRQEFLPSFPTIKKFAMGIRTESVGGKCVIEIKDGQDTLYELVWALADIPDSYYEEEPVEWKFKKGQTYQIVIHVEENDSPVYLRFTKDNIDPMLELGTARIGENVITGQLTSGLVYSYRPLSKHTLLFLTISWLGFLAALSLEVEQVVMWVFHRLKRNSGNV